MKEPYIEGPASHDGPESCAAAREDDGEALTGAHTGAVLSRETRHSRVPTPLSEAEGHTIGRDSARPRTTLRGRRPAARAKTPCARTGRSPVARRDGDRRDAPGRPRPYAGDARQGKSDGPVVPTKPPNNAGPGRGGGGGKGLAKGNTTEQNASRTQSRTGVPSALERVRRAAATREGDAVHRAPPPRHRRATPFGIPGTQAGRGAGSGWRDVGAVRRAAGGQPPGPARTIAPRSVSGEAVAASVHPEDRTGGNGRSASPRWRTSWSNARSSRCSM